PLPTWSPASPAASCDTRSPTSPPCPGPRSWSRTATRSCSSSTGSVPPWSPTGLPSCTSAGPPSRSCSARPASSPRNGPTASSPPPTRGLPPNTRPCNVSHPTTWSRRPTSTRPRPHPNPAPPKSAPGPTASACRCPTAADSAQKSGRPGTTPTPRPDIRGPVTGVTHQPRRDGPDAAPDPADLPRNKSTTRVSQQEREAQTTAAVHDSFVRRRLRLCVCQSVGRIGRHTVAVLERHRSGESAARTQRSHVLSTRISPYLRHWSASAWRPCRGGAEAAGPCIGDNDDGDVPALGGRRSPASPARQRLSG